MKRFLLTVLVCVVLVLTACGDETGTLTGWYLEADNGARLLICEDGDPLSLSDGSRSGQLFDGLDSGDRIEITCGPIAESWPGQAKVYTCKQLADGTPADLPAETLADLMELGYTFDFHTHASAAEPAMKEGEIMGYCGNTVTEVTRDGETFSFWGSDSVTLTDLLINLPYDPEAVCRCAAEFTVDTELGGGYQVDLSRFFVRCDEGQADLTAEQAVVIQTILEENCA